MISTKTIKSNAIKCAVRDKIESYLKDNKIGLFYDRDWTISNETSKIKWNNIEEFDLHHNFDDINDRVYSFKLFLFYRYTNESYYHSILVKLYEQPTYHMIKYDFTNSNVSKTKIIHPKGDISHYNFNKNEQIIMNMPFDGSIDIYNNNYSLMHIKNIK